MSKRDYSKFDETKFLEEIREKDWTENSNSLHTESASVQFNNFYNKKITCHNATHNNNN